MRLSADEKDRGYCALEHDEIIVTIDGVEVSHVVTADEEAGTVLRGVREADGSARFVDGEFVTETLHGKVAIITPEGFPRNRLYWVVPRVRERIRRWYRHYVWTPIFLRLLYYKCSRSYRIFIKDDK